MSDRLKELREKALSLPLTPGVYVMKDEGGQIIYIGKSRALKNRVTQYFREAGHTNVKTAQMVSRVRDFEYILTDTENEALLLENRLIKAHEPKYNIKLKDGKRDPYLKVTLGETYPRIEHCFEMKKDGARYFGPFTTSSRAYALKKSAEKLFSLPSCKRVFPRDFGKDRPCLYYSIGQCCGLCTGKVKEKDYRAAVKGALLYLNGSYAEIKKSLTADMEQAAEEMRYEAAAVYRDRIRELGRLTEKQKIVSSPDTNADVIALYRAEPLSCLTILQIRGGLLCDSENRFFTLETPDDSSALTSYLLHLYMKKADIPPLVLLGEALEDEDSAMLEGFLREQRGRKVTLSIPEKGEKKALCVLARENAKRQTLLKEKEHERSDKTLVALASRLGLEVLPQRIEAFDISNFGGDNITAGMVVFADGKPKKSDYRLFRIRESGGQDDYASMREAVRRRLERYLDGDESFSPLPDLLLLDGGVGHVSAVRGVLESLEDKNGVPLSALVPLFGMVKDGFHKTRTLTDGENEIDISRDRALFAFIYGIQEEVHRYTYGSMSKAKSKTLKRSSLEEIHGIGAKKAAALLSHFGTLTAVKKASREELMEVKGIGEQEAESLLAHFEEKKKAKEGKDK